MVENQPRKAFTVTEWLLLTFASTADWHVHCRFYAEIDKPANSLCPRRDTRLLTAPIV
jgi:hypothetical protein